MKISVAADERTGVADAVVDELRRRGHDPIVHGALSDQERDDWAWASEAAARDVAEGRAEQGVVCCWTGSWRPGSGRPRARTATAWRTSAISTRSPKGTAPAGAGTVPP